MPSIIYRAASQGYIRKLLSAPTNDVGIITYVRRGPSMIYRSLNHFAKLMLVTFQIYSVRSAIRYSR